MPFDHLLFFADAGNGDQFAFPIVADGVVRQDIYYVEPRRRQPHVGRSLADDFPGKVAARSTLGVGTGGGLHLSRGCELSRHFCILRVQSKVGTVYKAPPVGRGRLFR